MAQDVERAQQRLRQAEALVRFVEGGLASGSTNQNELRIAKAKYEAARLDLFDAEKAAAGTPPQNAAPASNPTPEPPPINTRVEQSQSPSSVSADTSPAASQADSPSRRNRRQRAQTQRSAAQDPEVVQQESVEDTSFSIFSPSTWFGSDENDTTADQDPAPVFDEFSDLPADVSVPPVPIEDPPVNRATDRRARAQAARVAEREPADPTEDSEVNQQQSNRDRAQAQRIENAAPGELSATSPAAAQVDSVVSRRAQAQIIRHDRIVASDPTSYESLTDEQLRAQTASTQAALNSLLALPTQERLRVQTQIDALENQLDLLDQETARRATRGRLEDQVESGKRAPEPVDDQEAQDLDLVPEEEDPFVGDEIVTLDEDIEQSVNANQTIQKLRTQVAVREQRKANGTAAGAGDWRFRVRLAPNADYLYNSEEPGILAPLTATDGVIFPYTPRIDTQYRAEYNSYNPTHNNYNYHFYKGSKVEFVTVTADFTAQDTNEANYLLAVITFFKSASKMFYGQDPQRGSPPPLLYMSGLGAYQFAEHPCVISEFNYNLPDNVDYIRARSQVIPSDNSLQYKRPLTTGSNGAYASLRSRLGALRDAFNNPISPGAENNIQAVPTLGLGEDTSYVPTAITITITFLPVQSRLQISQEFSLRDYASGKLIQKGYW